MTIGASGEAPNGQSLLKMDKDGNINLEGKTKITLKVGENSITLTEDSIITKAGLGKIETIANVGAISMESKSSEIMIKSSTTNTIKGQEIMMSSIGSIRIDSPDTDIT